MSYGQGSIELTNNPAAAGGGMVTGMLNGLSLVGTHGELGGNPLLHNSAFDLATFSFEVDNGANPIMILSPGGVRLSDNGQTSILSIVPNQTGLGDLGGTSNGTCILTNALTNQIVFEDTVFPGPVHNQFLKFDNNNKTYVYGDLKPLGNGMKVSVGDVTKNFLVQDTAGLFFNIDAVVDNYSLGDLSGVTNGLLLRIDNAAKNFFVTDTAGNDSLQILYATRSYTLGDAGGGFNNTRVSLNDISQTGLFGDIAGNGVNYDIINNVYTFGGSSIGSLFSIDNTIPNITLTQNGTRVYLLDAAFNITQGNVAVGHTVLSAAGTLEFLSGATSIFKAAIGNGITTQTTGGVSAPGNWRFGSSVAAASAVNLTRYLEVNVNGTVFKIATMT